MTIETRSRSTSTGTDESYYGEPFDEEGVLNYARWLPHASESQPHGQEIPHSVTVLHRHHQRGDPLLQEAIKFNAKCEAAMSKEAEEGVSTATNEANSSYGEPFDEEGVLNYARWLAPETRRR